MDNQGLNGAFGRWLKRTIARAVDALATIADTATFGLANGLLQQIVSSIDTGLEDITGGSFWQKGVLDINNIELTNQEEAILDNWYDTKFQPFYINLVKATNDAFSTENESLALNKINVVLRKIGFLNEYYKTNETAGLSQNAINARMQLLASLNKPLVKEIENEFGASVTANYNAIQSDFAGLISTNVQGMAYQGKIYPIVINNQIGTSPSNNNPFGPTAINPSNTLPTITSSGNIKGDAFIVEPETGLPPATPVSGNTAENKDWWKWILGGAAVLFVGSKAIKSSKK